MQGKSVTLLGGLGLGFLLPFIVVVVMLFATMGSAGAEEACDTSETTGKAFGWPTDEHEPALGYLPLGTARHTGLDYRVSKGSTVRAAEEGEVVSTDGDWIKIRHGEGLETWYQFFESKSVRVGDKVGRGTEIGKSGSGTEDGPGLDGEHLHFEMRVRKDDDGDLEPEDPTDQIGEEASESASAGCSCEGALVGSNNQQKAFNYFASNGYSKEQAAGIVGNMIHESSVEPARLQNTAPGTVTKAKAAIDSPLGWGIVQWTPAGKMIRPSLAATNDDEKKVESLEWQLEFLKKQLAGEGPLPEADAGTKLRATKTVEDAAVAFGRWFERFAGSEDLSNPRYIQRKTAARALLEIFGGGEGGAGGGGCGAGNGDIVQTALGLAWDTPGHGKNRSDARPSYQEAMPKYNGATDIDPYSDCGVFVATVMVMSGVDKDYQRRSTGEQLKYVRASSKYETFDNITDVDQLRPGDILVKGSEGGEVGHTYLYTGNYKGGDGKTYNAASASLHGHVPEATNVYFDGFTVARIKQSGGGEQDG
ncbi:peptidase M23-like protein [Kribbella amoyensis]|uniref:Peptidase M23-like protein n=1 Tax=Kribbella amoyensis TaxID=996641 RepID=A0A561BN94_9ACTN|nr:phage tail tip lysozyme [Kribbella amoyensis]TWD80366.1 peptidase M23-like protein [Kribbella amoyensis]